MVRTLCLIALVLTLVPAPGAAAQPQSAELMTLERAAIDAGLTKLAWEGGIAHSVELYKPKTAKEAAADFADPATIAGRPLLAPYQKQLATLATLLGGLGPRTYFFYGKVRPLFPFAVATFNGQKCLVAYVATGDVHDAAKLGSTKQRAARVAASHALPALRGMAGALEGTDLRAVAVFVTYGVKDPLRPSDFSTVGETVGIAVPIAEAKALAEGRITNAELLKKATVLLSDFDALPFTQVQLQVE